MTESSVDTTHIKHNRMDHIKTYLYHAYVEVRNKCVQCMPTSRNYGQRNMEEHMASGDVLVASHGQEIVISCVPSCLNDVYQLRPE
jgi:hypothetical protein